MARPRAPTVAAMRWDALFADMESQLEAAQAQDRAAQVAELTRAERSAVLLADRVRAAVGAEVSCVVRSGETVAGVVADAGPAWLLLGGARQHLVPTAALVTVEGLGVGVAPAAGPLRRLGLAHALRAVARDRSVVRVVTTAGTLEGRLEAVGADHADVALSYPDSGRPTGRRRTVALAALDLVTGV